MLDAGELAASIRARVTMREVTERYLGASHGKYAKCPFHAEKTASMRIYEHDYHCYGCGAHGDMVDFVGRLFNLKPIEAMRRMNDDFGLGLAIGRRPSLRERAAAKRAAQSIIHQREAVRREAEQAEAAYWTAFDEWLRWDRQLEDNRPTPSNMDITPLFAEAVHNITEAQYNLEQAEGRRCAARWKYHQ